MHKLEYSFQIHEGLTVENMKKKKIKCAQVVGHTC